MRILNSTRRAARDMDSGNMLGSSLENWKGRTYAPLPGDSEATLRYKHERQSAFVRDLTAAFVPAENMIMGVLDNVCDHVMGSEPTWNLTGSETEIWEKLLTAAWNNRGLLGVCQTAIRTRVRDGEGVVCVRVPRGALGKLNQPGATPLFVGGELLRFEALLEPERLTITEDQDTLTLRAVLELGQDKDGIERGKEIAFVDGQGYTNLILELNGKRTLLWRMRMGGRLPYVQIQGRALITQGMVDNQAGANMIMTAAASNSELAGQIMEHFHNLQPQLDAQGKPLPAVRGPGGELYTQDTIAVQTIVDSTGQEREEPVILKGTYERHGPVSSEALDFTLSRCEHNIYAEAKQRHYLMADKASATGEARKTAMSSFFKSLNGYRTDALTLLRELITTTLAMSYALCQQPVPEVQVEPVLTDRLVEPTPEDRAADREDVRAGIISKEAARARQGFVNSLALQKQIDAELAAMPPAPAPAPSPAPGGNT